jgi:oligopeptidase B
MLTSIERLYGACHHPNTDQFRSIPMRFSLFAIGMLYAATPLLNPALAAATSEQKDTMTETPNPPMAEPRSHSFTAHGYTVEDPYHWLKDQSYPVIDDKDVLDYLKAENAYFEAQMAPHQAKVEKIFQEMKGRIKEEDSSVPQKDGDYIYWVSFAEGQQYKQHWRKPVTGGPDQLILDENLVAADKEYFKLGELSISPNGRLMAYAYDNDGSERFTAYVRDLSTGKDLPDVVPETLSSIVWDADSTGFVYGRANENWRTDKVYYHLLGEEAAVDTLLYHEKDIGFSVGVGLTAQEDYIVIGAGDSDTSEVRLIPANDPLQAPKLVSPRKTGRLYEADVRDGTLYLYTNDDNINFRIATAPLSDSENWTTLLSGSPDNYLTGIALFKDFFALEGRIDGLDYIRLHRYDDIANPDKIAFKEESYVASLGDNPEYDVDKVRISYESMVSPDTVFDYHVATRTLETLKVQEIPSGYDAAQYVTERLMIPARDGVKVPVSILYKKGFAKNGTAPLHLYGYGAYGYAIDPGFDASRLSMVDRGFAYAIAHIRGGDDLGYQWFLDGKLTKRTNTFNDFVDVAKGLIERGYTGKGRIVASGRSAGGELMGAVVNQAPELFGAIAAHVPFVDVLNTMMDESLPLTPGEWPLWGNPITDKAAFELIRSYSPYDNIAAKDYPPMLWTGGLNDPRVTYWEPAKMVAKLRAMKTDDNLLLLKTNMGAGHGGKSGRWERLREYAEEAAFFLWQMGVE